MGFTHVTRGFGILEGFLAKKRAEIANSLIPSTHRNGRIADIGCGTYPIFLMNTLFAEKYALDKSIYADNSELQLRNIKFLSYDIETGNRMPFSTGFFDVVTMLAVLEHIDPEISPSVLIEIHRILKPGGVFVMTTPAPWTDMILKLMAKLHLVSPVEIQEHKASYSPSRISCLLKEASFPEDKIKYGYFEMFMNIWISATKMG